MDQDFLDIQCRIRKYFLNQNYWPNIFAIYSENAYDNWYK